MTPRTVPMSPCPRVRQPGCSATLRPARSSTSGNHVSENTMSGNSPCSGRQVLVGGRLCVVEVEIASVGVVGALLGLRGRNAAGRHRQVRVRGEFGLVQFDVAETVVVMLVGLGPARFLNHGSPSASRLRRRYMPQLSHGCIGCTTRTDVQIATL